MFQNSKIRTFWESGRSIKEVLGLNGEFMGRGVAGVYLGEIEKKENPQDLGNGPKLAP